MRNTMPAWQWTGTGLPLTRHVVAIPEPGPTEVLVEVRAAGMCHSDVGQLDEPSWAATITRNPITLGHEIAGVVAAVGSAVTTWEPGDRVGVHPLGGTVPGYSRDGGYASYTVTPCDDLVAVPAGLPFDLAAAGTDAGMTAHHAVVTVAGVVPGSRVGIIGLGGLGQFGAQIAMLRGAEVHGADKNPEALALGRAMGLSSVHSSAEELAGLDLDAVVDFAGFGSTTAAALAAIRQGGHIVMVGMGAVDTTLNTADVIHKRAHIHGSSGGTKDDIAQVYEHLRRGEITPTIEHLAFSQVPAGIERLRAGRLTGRLVVLLDGE